MLTSSRRGIVYPNTDRSDSADVPRDIAALVAALEVDVLYGQGTLAARPTSTSGSPGIQGRLYMATDQSPHALYYDYGTGWDSVGSLAAGSVGTTQLADGSVTGGAAGAGVKIAATTITHDNIVAGTIRGGGNEITAGSITGADINAAALKPSGGAGGATEALRALGTAAGTAAAGTHASQHSRTGADPLVISTFVGSGTLAARPSTSLVTGMVYTATDVAGGTSYQYNGTSWVPMGGGVSAAFPATTAAGLPGSPVDGQIAKMRVGIANDIIVLYYDSTIAKFVSDYWKVLSTQYAAISNGDIIQNYEWLDIGGPGTAGLDLQLRWMGFIQISDDTRGANPGIYVVGDIDTGFSATTGSGIVAGHTNMVTTSQGTVLDARLNHTNGSGTVHARDTGWVSWAIHSIAGIVTGTRGRLLIHQYMDDTLSNAGVQGVLLARWIQP